MFLWASVNASYIPALQVSVQQGWVNFETVGICDLYTLWFYILVKGCCPYPICHVKHQNNIFISTHPLTPENLCDQILFLWCEISYICTIGNRTAKSLPTILQQVYSTKIENITIRIAKTLTFFYTWYSKLLQWSVQQSLWILFQEVLIGMHNF